MPAPQLSISDLLDRGLTALPEVPVGIAGDATATIDVSAVFRNVAGSAVAGAGFKDLADAIIAARDPQATATAFINGKYAALGGAGGDLGATVTAVQPCPDGVGWFRHYRAGSIYWHPAIGAHDVRGPIRAKWAELGWERGLLGYPTSDQLPGRDPDQLGLFNRFQGGMILWHPQVDRSLAGLATVARVQLMTTVASATGTAAPGPAAPSPSVTAAADAARGAVVGAAAFAPASAVHLASPNLVLEASPTGGHVVTDLAGLATVGGMTVAPDRGLELGSSAGAHEVHGAIGAHYAALGGSGSVLGYPVTDETGTPDGVGRYNHFQAGSIYWSPSTAAHETHGLIRQLWAQHGWEQNPGLGYPISDELIPDRRIGHRHPEQRRKPITAVPADVVKLPAEAAHVGFSPLVSNLPVRLLAHAAPDAATVTAAALPGLATEGPAIAAIAGRGGHGQPFGEVSAVGLAGLGPVVAGLAGGQGSTPAPEPSLNRFGDFESGVLFWRRGATAAQQLQPWTQASDGESMRRSAADVVAAMQPSLQPAFGRLSGASLAGMAFAGTTPYSWDGASVRNRRHRVAVTLLGSRASGPFGLPTGPVPVIVEISLEVMFEPIERLVTVSLADWSWSGAADIDASPPLDRQLHEQLDPLLFRRVDLFELPDTDAGAPIAVLAVKTMSNGDVAVFVEPAGHAIELGSVVLGNAGRLIANP